MNFFSAIAGLSVSLMRPKNLMVIVASDFLPWVLWQEPKNILRSYGAYARAFSEILSVSFLLRTLLSPWKGIAEEMPSALQWDKFLQALFVNLVTRMIGMVIRLVAIILSVVAQLLLLVLFILLFAGWFVFPFIVIGVLSFILVLV